MAPTNRFFALASFLVSAWLVAACSGTPQISHPDDGPNGNLAGGPDASVGGFGGGPQINVGDGGNTQVGIGAGGEAGEPGDNSTVCGDGIIALPETCDDGNTKPGDGCDGNCRKEGDNWDCSQPGTPCIPTTNPTVCGDSKVDPGESCDLGQDSAGHSLNDGTAGCDDHCKIVNGWSCAGSGMPCVKLCGDGVVQSMVGEQCDDGTNDGAHGCNTICRVITGWKCPPGGGACSVDVYCGNGQLDPGEQCDDHNLRNYDGCSSTCFIDSGWSCPPTGGTCSRICGNGKLDPGETCDDSNFYSGDGCDSNCQTEANYDCSAVGQPCLSTPAPLPPQCGNGKLETGEVCDDGNSNGGDGCSSVCQVESGWRCPTPNAACVAQQCGDGMLAGNEQCDDGVVDGLHGCSPTCTIMPNAVCPANGGACVPMVCGDGKVTGTEQCDSGLNDGKHGCSTTCQLVPGWICPLAGTPCTEVCGDGLVVGDEQCDETADVLCCSATCKLKPGYVCDPSKTPHSQVATPYCGNGVVNGPSNPTNTVLGSEQCDDGNVIPFDGCSPTCTNEPLCGTFNTYLPAPTATNYQCFAHCGDGLVLPPEQCDDGNTLNGDGCDSNCKVELVPGGSAPAWTCSQPPPGALLSLPVVWRDFTPRTHPQFSIDPVQNRRLPGMALNALRAVNIGGLRPFRYVPDYNTAFASPNFGGGNLNQIAWTMNGPGWAPPPNGPDVVLSAAATPATLTNGNATLLLTPAGRFAQWYLDVPSVNKTFASTINLRAVGGGAFQYSCDAAACDSTFPAGGFFPLDNKGWVASGQETALTNGHNFSFTTEMRSWFAFKGGEQLAFFGDDDLWVFINGQLTLDIGGIHSKTNGNFTLNANGSATSCVENVPLDGGNLTNCTTINLGLVANNIYEIAIFNAERHITESNFQLTLTGFNSAPSVCTPICGDGYAVGSEQCDRGNLNVSPAGNTYGQCTTACKLGPYCGDKALLTPPEACDNGLNIDAYLSQTPSGQVCAPGCVLPVYCGDHTIQRVNGEQCDDGTAANVGGYGHCQANCRLGARCGDGSIQGGNGEQCDDGANNGSPSSTCDASCKNKCGNGQPDPGEQCDDGSGASGNGTALSTCDLGCKNKCGNGKLDPGEQCDDGKNDGSYGTCKSDCTFAPFCGDMIVRNCLDGTNACLEPPNPHPLEICDNGPSNSPTAYGANSCTDQCLPGGLCGDGVVNGNEQCDDGKNTGLPGSCTSDCSAYVPSSFCGNGKLDAAEQCDDGTSNGTPSSKCDNQCRFKCGNARIDGTEQCDNGVNDGSYGTCTSTCTLAGYCGDGVKNGNEQCDQGAQNVATSAAYGSGVCTKACKAAPFCGDGRIQAAFEECEGNYFCMNCKSTIIK